MRTRRFELVIVIIAALALGAGGASAGPIAIWDHTGQPGNQAFTPGVGSPQVVAANLVRGTGLAASAASNSLSSTGWSGSDAGDYFELGFSVTAGYEVELDEVILSTRSSATGPGTIGLYSSLDGFTAPFATIVQPDSAFVNSLIDLSPLGVVTGSFAIRLIEIGDTQADGVGATAATGTFRIGDYQSGSNFIDTQISGTTRPVPEPGGAALAFAAVAGLWLLRRRHMGAWVLALSLMSLVSASETRAATLTVAPSIASANVGDVINVSVAIEGLDSGAPTSLGAFDLELRYDPAVLSLSGVSFGSGLDLGIVGSLQSTDTTVLGVVAVLEISFEDALDLSALQPDGFPLFTAHFTAAQLGASGLDVVAGFGGLALADAVGDPITATFTSSSVEVVPEPGSFALFALALGGLVATRRRRPLASLGVVALLLVAADARAVVVINEALISHTGTDTTEFVELYGTPGESLSGLSLIAVEGDAAPGNTGGIDRRIDFGAADAIGVNGFFLVGNPAGLGTNYGVTPDRTLAQDSFENSTLTLALVETASLTGSTVTGLEIVRDAVSITDGGVGDVAFFGAPNIGPDGTFLPAGARRIVDGQDTNSAADFVFAVFNLGPGNTPTAGSGVIPATPRTIPEIQGTGAATPFDGQRVETSGVVVADFQGAAQLGGFFLQDVPGDGLAATSDGIFVFAPGSIDVAVGDRVTVVGTIRESLRQTRIQGVTSVIVTGTTPVPAATTVAFPEPVEGDLERFEGMLVAVPSLPASPITVSQTYFVGRYGQLTLAAPDDLGLAGRLLQPTNVFRPGTPDALVLADANRRRLLIVDDGQDVNPLGDNPVPVPYLGPAPGIVLRGGDRVTNLVGALDQGRINSDQTNPGIDYRLQPTAAPVFAVANPRPTLAPAVSGRVRVASFNVLNYFSTIDAGPDVCGPSANLDCRGADSATEFTRQRTKILAAIRGLDAHVVGLIEIENNPSASLQDLVGGLNALGPAQWAYVNTGSIGTDAIKVGFIYQPALVALQGPFRTLTNAIDPRAIDTKNRPALAQTFRERATGELFTVAVNHFKSKGSNCDTVSTPGELVDPDTGDGQGFCNLTRTSMAEALADWLAGDPTGSGDPDFMILGDLNAYAHEDPVESLRAVGYVDLLDQLYGPASTYTYTFDGQTGALDHLLPNAALRTQVSGAGVWHINDDEPAVLDYNTEFNPPGYYQPNVFRASDHDPSVAGLTLCVDRSDLNALLAASRATPTDPRYDLDGDGRVTVADGRRLATRFTLPGGAACP